MFTDDPGTPGNHNWEINTAFTMDVRAEEHEYEAPILDINYGWGERIQLKLELPWLAHGTADGKSTSGLGNTLLGMKWRFYENQKHGLDVSVYPQLEINNPTHSVERGLVERGPALKLPLEMTKMIGPVEVNSEAGYWLHRLLAVIFLLVSVPNGYSQQTPSPNKPLTLDESISFALAHYPAVRASLERVSAAQEGVGLSSTIYLPRTDLLWQSNRATRNNIFGLLFPQSVVPPISGPVLPTTSDRGAWGSAAGVLISWEPFDFGYRGATVGVAKAAQTRASAELSLTKLDVAGAVANAFLVVAAAQQQVRAAQADVDRRQMLANVVHVLVQQELRPGVDASRADAELAAAKILLIRSQEFEREAKAALAEILGIAGTEVEIDASSLIRKTPAPYASPSPLTSHPVAQVGTASVFEVRARERVLSKSFYPRFNLQGSISGRGSGANPDGTFGTGTDGLSLERRNWAVGLTATFSVLDFASLHFKKQIEQSNERAQQADYEKVLQNLTAQSDRAKAAYESAVLVSQNTPVELQAAQLGESQARARYQAGLASIVEVADAQRLLLQAETEDDLARLALWRATLGQALAQGDLEPFLVAVRNAR